MQSAACTPCSCCRTECARRGLSVVSRGWLKGAELEAAMACGDVFVSACATEAIGLCLMEALASGVPVRKLAWRMQQACTVFTLRFSVECSACAQVVAPNAGGIPEFVHPGVNGFLYSAFGKGRLDIQNAARLVERALSERDALSAAAVNSMRNSGWEKAMAELEGAYYGAVDPDFVSR